MNQLCPHQFYKRQYLRRQWLGRTNPLAINSHCLGERGRFCLCKSHLLYVRNPRDYARHPSGNRRTKGSELWNWLAAAESAIEQTHNPPVRVVHPNSTGNALTSKELEWLRSSPEQILVVIDEAYFEFSQTVVSELLQRPNWMVLRTFSKAFRLAALRVGYAIAHPELIVALENPQPYNLPSFSQAAALVTLQQRQLLLESIPPIDWTLS